MSLHDYDGAATHAGERGRRHTTRACCSDHSGTIAYAFNAQGYRGADLDRQAEAIVFAVGCSHAFGVGVAEELTWPAVFCRGFADHYGIPAGRVNLINLSQGAAANDYIARVILTQATRITPTLVLAAFTHKNRAEHLDGPSICNIGPWRVEDPEDLIGTPSGDVADAFYDWYSDELGAINAIKNILLVQEFLRARQIPYLFSWIGGAGAGAGHPAVRRLLELVDKAPLCPTSIEDADIFIDRAADGAHPGPQSHARFAGRMLATCRALYPRERFPPRAATASEPEAPIAPPPPAAGDEAAPPRLPTRWQRLRAKMRRIRKEDPNVYPLY